MSFFSNYKNKNSFLSGKVDEARNTSYYDNNDYYIANKQKIDTSTLSSDHSSYYGTTNAAKLFISYGPSQNKYVVTFPAILESYSETFSPSFDQEQLYGRMDPVQKYKNTSRSIKVAFKILAYDEIHSSQNLHALSTLAQFLYPVYSTVGTTINNATSISESPLWRVKFANLIQSTLINKNINTSKGFHTSGLLVAPTQFNFQPNIEAGFFVMNDSFLFPKEIKLDLSFNAIHENTLGWIKQNDAYDWIGNYDQDSGNYDTSAKVFPWGDISFSAIATPLSEEAEIEQQPLTEAPTDAETETPE